ncbi:hypothetical protein CR983_02025 [Candidatus Saccharibacteria bacterium]|nr:MAG: hypothetical protein CR983_02025 [Candidatus Saccharibacteria bacterium]
MATTRRHSKYTEAVKYSLARAGHATNAQLADDLRRNYPHLSDTTVHRITQRLIEDGLAQYAPHAVDGAMVFDANTTAHDHFECAKCGMLRDIVVPDPVRDALGASINDCTLDGPLKIIGTCRDCMS